MGLLSTPPLQLHTSHNRSRALASWMSSGTVGASQDTIERTTLAHKYVRRRQKENTDTEPSTQPFAEGGEEMETATDHVDGATEKMEEEVEEPRSTRTSGTSDDKCTICISDYEQGEYVR